MSTRHNRAPWWALRPRVPMIRQHEAAECGLACVAMIAAHHGCRVDLAMLRRCFPVSPRGMGLARLLDVASRIGLAVRPVRAGLRELQRLQLPAVLHWDFDHFVVLRRVRGARLWVHDPARGERVLGLREVSPHFTGVAVEFTPTADFTPGVHGQRLRLRDLWSRAPGLWRVLTQVLVLSLVLQVVTIVLPLQMQFVVDEVLARSDHDLLLVLAIGFGLLVLISATIGALRELIVLHAASRIDFQIGTNLFRHLLRLPVDWFERRHVGDIVSRFSATGPVRDLLSRDVVTTLIDGVMALATLALMARYSPLLALIVAGTVCCYLVVRLAGYRALHRRSEDAIVSAAREQSVFIETVRAIQPIRLAGAESRRLTLWQQRRVDTVEAGLRVGRLHVAFGSANGLLFGLENVAVITLGAYSVLAGSMSTGMLFAFMVYKRHFSDAAVALVERGIDFRLLRLHLDRIADIAHATPALPPALAAGTPSEDLADAGAPLAGAIAVERLAFRHAPDEPWLFRGAGFTVAPGECVMLTGASGVGKTTLLKLILGLYPPSGGRVRIGGRPAAWLRTRTTGGIAAVMQDDSLLVGSIADNITGFDAEPDNERVRESAALAAIDAEILAMPMGYETRIGEGGGGCSGGQRQRLLLARALYRRPRLLCLDEGTANLDPDTQQQIFDTLTGLQITRLWITHDPALLARADRVLQVAGGRVATRQPQPQGMPSA